MTDDSIDIPVICPVCKQYVYPDEDATDVRGVESVEAPLVHQSCLDGTDVDFVSESSDDGNANEVDESDTCDGRLTPAKELGHRDGIGTATGRLREHRERQ